MRLLRLCLVLAVVAAAAGGDGLGATDQAPHGTIVLSVATKGSGSRLIELAALDGRSRVLTRPVDAAVRDGSPAWSQRAKLLAFLRFAGGATTLIVADGEGRIRRAIPVARSSAPEWAPDGTAIVLAQSLGNGGSLAPPRSQIVLVDPRKGTTRVLARGTRPTFLGSHLVAFLRVRWHVETEMGGAQTLRPNGAQLLTVATAGGRARVLHSTGADSSHSNAQEYSGAVGSPDARRVALTVGDDQGSLTSLLLVDRLGRSQWPGGGSSGPTAIAWSPTGDRLAVIESDRLLLSDGLRQRELPATAPRAQQPVIRGVAWSPDGRFLAAVSCRFFTSRCELLRLRLGESRWHLLARVYVREGMLVWRP